MRNLINASTTIKKGANNGSATNVSLKLTEDIMSEIGLPTETIQSFRKGFIKKSTSLNIMCNVSDKDKVVINQLDKQGFIVYHVIHNTYACSYCKEHSLMFEAIEMVSYLCVAKDIFAETGLSNMDLSESEIQEVINDELENYLRLAKQGCVLAYVINKTQEIKEFGDIVVEFRDNALVRVG